MNYMNDKKAYCDTRGILAEAVLLELGLSGPHCNALNGNQYMAFTPKVGFGVPFSVFIGVEYSKGHKDMYTTHQESEIFLSESILVGQRLGNDTITKGIGLGKTVGITSRFKIPLVPLKPNFRYIREQLRL